MQMGVETRVVQSSRRPSAVLPFVLSGNCKSISALEVFADGSCKLRSFRLDRARELREDTTFDRASSTEVEMVEGCNWSVVAVRAEQNEDKTCVVEMVSDCASGDAGFDGTVVQGGERKIIIGSIGCPKVDGVRIGKSNYRSVKTGNESLLSLD